MPASLSASIKIKVLLLNIKFNGLNQGSALGSQSQIFGIGIDFGIGTGTDFSKFWDSLALVSTSP